MTLGPVSNSPRVATGSGVSTDKPILTTKRKRSEAMDEGPLAALRPLPKRTQASSVDELRNRAASTIIQGMRSHTAHKAESQMLRTGEMWKTAPQVLSAAGLTVPQEPLTIERLSSVNLSRLRQRLGSLSSEEAGLFDRFTQQRFFATHFTNAELDHPSSSGSTMTIFSRQKLEQRQVDFDRDHTFREDIEVKGDDGFVFFALECGDEPQKLHSRFGDTLYRVPFDHPAFQQTAWGALDDLLVVDDEPHGESARARLPGLSNDEREVMANMYGHAEREYDRKPEAFDDIFSGKDLVAGAALTIIYKLREMNEVIHSQGRSAEPQAGTPVQPAVEKLLASSSPAELNTLMASLLTPEIRVPVHFFSTSFEKFSKKDLSDIGTWNGLVDGWDKLSPAERESMQSRERPVGAKALPPADPPPVLSADADAIADFIDELMAKPGEIQFRWPAADPFSNGAAVKP